MPTPSDFQKQCEKLCLQTLAEIGYEAANRVFFEGEWRADEEFNYIQFDIKSTEVTVFIYDDEAGLHSPTYSNTFEVPDFDQPIDLINAFLRELRKLLYRK